MSTKIYNGFRLPRGTDVLELNRQLRDTLNPVRQRLDAALIADQFARDVDRRLFGFPENDDTPPGGIVDVSGVLRHHQSIEVSALIQTAWANLTLKQHELRHAGKTRSWDYDPNRFELSVARDTVTGDVLAVLFCESKELRQAFMDFPGVEEYGYWNNTEAPEGVTRKQWEHRRRQWDRVLPHSPVDSMLTFQLRSDTVPLDHPQDMMGDIGNAMPTRARRARWVANQFLTYRISAHNKAAGPPDLNNIYTLITEADLTELTTVVAGALPEIDQEFLDRPFIDLHRIISDEDMAHAWAALTRVWNGLSPHLG